MAKRSGAYGGDNPYPTNMSTPCPCCGMSKCGCAGNTCQAETAARNAYARPSAVEYGTAPELDVLYQGKHGFYVPPLFDEDGDGVHPLNPLYSQDIGL